MKFLSALGVLLLAIFLQLFLASVGLHFNLVLAALITFAFALDDFWKLLVADLLAVFILNWQPAPSVTLTAFALIPIVVFLLQRFIHSEFWIGNLIAIFFGFLAFYLIAAPAEFSAYFLQFLEDVTVGLAVGELILFAV